MTSLFQYSFIQNAFLAGTVVAVVAGFVGYFMVTRGLTFAGHALSHIGFAGAAGALLIAADPIVGMLAFTIAAGIGIGVFGKELREEDITIGIVMTLALAFGALFISLYNGYAEQAYSILFGTILGISHTDVVVTLIVGIATIVLLAAIFRPLLFSSIDPEVAEARGVPVRVLGIVFLILAAIAVSMSVEVVGVLLVFTLLVGPAATAMRLVHTPIAAVMLSVALALAFTWLGIFLAATGTWPVTFYIATISFAVYLPVRLLTS
ncbi:MAG TPA: metal ABC transporter permease [Candidatus Paceibacterota bacterium]|nr:metal ABC transporter permease [Candidatus Paceibacterota bacterium]